MARERSKAYKKAVTQIDKDRKYSLRMAIELAKKVAFAKFDETINIDVALGVDPRKADQMIRGTVVLPHGTGRTVRVVAIVSAEKEDEAKAAGADFVGGQDIVDRIKGGWLDFESVVATPDMMRFVGGLGKILGPRGMMPNPKVGTVSLNIGAAVKEIKAGRVEYKVDKYGLIHLPAGKRSFKDAQLFENLATIIDTLLRVKPSAAKGTYMKSVAVSTTMGPGVRVDTTALKSEVESAKGTLLT
jgi:large subunit ribosomal protein L1